MTITSSLFKLDYGSKIEREIANMLVQFEELSFDTGQYSKRWLAIKLLEKDADILERVQSMEVARGSLPLPKNAPPHVESMLGEDFDLLTADRRYGYINGIVRQALHRPLVDRITFTDRVDHIVTHKWIGLPIFFAVMYVIFRLVIDVSSPFLHWTDSVINGPVARWLSFPPEPAVHPVMDSFPAHRRDRCRRGWSAGLYPRAVDPLFLPGVT